MAHSKVLAVAHGGLFVYETETGNLIKLWREPYELYGKIYKVLLSKTDSRMFVRYDSMAGMWDWQTEELLWFSKKPSEDNYLRGSFLWDTFNSSIIFINESDETQARITYYDDKTGDLIKTVDKERKAYLGDPAIISNDGRYIAVVGVTNIRLWDMDTGKDYSIFFSTKYPLPSSLAFSPDNKFLAVGGDEGIVRIYDLNEDIGPEFYPQRKLVKEINTAMVRCMTFSEDSAYLLVSKNEGGTFATSLFDSRNWERRFSYPYVLETSNFNSNGNIIATNYDFILLLKDKIYSSIGSPEEDTTLYPNPTSNIVNIPFELLAMGNVNIAIYNESGVLVETITNKTYDIGNHTISYNCESLPIGTYFCVIKSNNHFHTRKFVVSK